MELPYLVLPYREVKPCPICGENLFKADDTSGEVVIVDQKGWPHACQLELGFD